MGIPLEDVVRRLPKKQQQEIRKRSQELIAEEVALQQLRKAMDQTQTALAKKLKIGQEGVSRIETRSDLMISTLRKYVEALGGELTLRVEFPDAPPVILSGFREVADRK